MTNRPTNEFGGGKTGFAHLLAAGRYSLAGIRDLAKEAAVRHEVLAFAAGLVVLIMCDARFSDYLVLSILFLIALVRSSTVSVTNSLSFVLVITAIFFRSVILYVAHVDDVNRLVGYKNLLPWGL